MTLQPTRLEAHCRLLDHVNDADYGVGLHVHGHMCLEQRHSSLHALH